ncbi:MAG: hypothetical protein WD960_13830 [Gemmatimonadota bacterium]
MSQVTPFPSDRSGLSARPPVSRDQGRRPLTPEELVDWLSENREAIADRWLLEVRSRVEGVEGEIEELLREFLGLLVDFLPFGLGPYRDQVLPSFHQASELYGNLGAIRGLAAGEAVEEAQLLREVLFRFIFRDLPSTDGPGLGLRELLQLSRLVDHAVTHASVGHTDTLFFNLFHGTGVPDTPAREVLDEVRTQVRALAAELGRLRMLEEGETISE